MKSHLLLFIALVWAVSASAITIETVPVGDAGNPATSGERGGVSYPYYIGKYEVTVGEYTAFLNAVAATDSYGLYNPAMATDLYIAGIAQNGSSPNYTYSVIGSPNHPVTYVGWGDAARFVNWLSNGQPTGPQDNTTTEDGAYTLNGATTGAVLYYVLRNKNAKWFIPTDNEWYKAAYYQPAAAGGDSDNY
jgi:sulfatase modifying factor 1